MASNTAIIIGGGIAGPALALSLNRIGVHCTIYELRQGPATIGGAINLTPNAMRFLDYVGLLSQVTALGCPTEKIEMFSIHSGKRLGDLPFGSIARHGYSSLRIDRNDFQSMLLRAVKDAGIDIRFNKKLVKVEEQNDDQYNFVKVFFEDGTSATGDVLFGCDGIHSAVRSQFVEPTRASKYTGISAAYGFAPRSAITHPIHFSNTSINRSCSGSLLLSYCDAEKASIYVAGVMEVSDLEGEDGWRVRGKVADETRDKLLRRFESEKLPCIREMTNSIQDLFFYPVFTLGKSGEWYRGRVLLIGDAVHAMPPGGHSVGLAFEDAILVARLIEQYKPADISDIFTRFVQLRKPRVEKDFTKAEQRWEGVKTVSWWRQWISEWILGILLYFFGRYIEKSFGYNIFNEEL